MAAGFDFEGFGIAVARWAALRDIGDVDVASVEPCRLEQAVEQTTRRADEGLALTVLVLARRFTDCHHAGGHRAVPGHRLGAGEVQRAGGALGNASVELEHLLGRRHHWRSLVHHTGLARAVHPARPHVSRRSSSATCTALVAAPLRRLSALKNSAMPCSRPGSRRIRPTWTSSLPATDRGIG